MDGPLEYLEGIDQLEWTPYLLEPIEPGQKPPPDEETIARYTAEIRRRKPRPEAKVPRVEIQVIDTTALGSGVVIET